MSNNTIKAALLAMVIPAALAQAQVKEVTINGLTDVQGQVFYLNSVDAIRFSWTGEYDPSSPDAHYKLLDSTEEPLPYTVTAEEFCEGFDFIPNCTWSWLVQPTQLGIDGQNGSKLYFLTNNGNNAVSTLVVNYDDVPTDDDDWKNCQEGALNLIQQRMSPYLYRVDYIHSCDYQAIDEGLSVYHVQFYLLDQDEDDMLGNKVKDVLAYSGEEAFFEFDCVEDIHEGEQSICSTYFTDKM